jgi:hypothetical protein
VHLDSQRPQHKDGDLVGPRGGLWRNYPPSANEDSPMRGFARVQPATSRLARVVFGFAESARKAADDHAMQLAASGTLAHHRIGRPRHAVNVGKLRRALARYAA